MRVDGGSNLYGVFGKPERFELAVISSIPSAPAPSTGECWGCTIVRGDVALTIATRRVLLLGLALLVGAIASEAALRLIAPQPRSWLDIYRQEPNKPFYSQLPDILETVATGEGTWHVRTDSHGRRVPLNDRNASASRTVLALGDSFTFGQGVEFEASFVGLLGEQLGDGFRMVNAGVGGYGPVQYRAVLESYLASEGSPSLVLVSVFTGNDFLDCIWDKRLVVVDGALASSNSPTRAWLKQNLHLYRLISSVFQRFAPVGGSDKAALAGMYQSSAWEQGVLRQALGVFEGELSRINDLCREHGIPLIVVLIPTAESVYAIETSPSAGAQLRDYSLPITKAAEALRALGVNAFDLTSTLHSLGARAAYFARDGHLTPVAGDAVARALLPRIREALATESGASTSVP
jgi:hypothetical protein